MNGKILIDTNIIINSARTRDKSSQIDEIVFAGMNPVISASTLTELWSGKSIENPLELQYIEAFLQGVEIIYPTEKIYKKAGELLRKYQNTEDYVDRIIAATAIENEIPLMTLNAKHFENIKELDLILATN